MATLVLHVYQVFWMLLYRICNVYHNLIMTEQEACWKHGVSHYCHPLHTVWVYCSIMWELHQHETKITPHPQKNRKPSKGGRWASKRMSKLLMNRILVLSTTQGHLRTIKLCHKQTHFAKLFSCKPFSSQIYKKSIHTHNKTKQRYRNIKYNSSD